MRTTTILAPAMFSSLLVAAFSLSPAQAQVLVPGDIVAMEDGAYDRVVKYDPATGAETLLCTTTLYGTQDLAVSHDGMIYLAGYFFDQASGFTSEAIVEIDSNTCQERTVMEDSADLLQTSLGGIAIEGDGSLVVTDTQNLGVIRVNPATGEYSTVSEGNRISASLKGVDVGPDGDIFVVAATGPAFLPGVVRIDPQTGEQVRVTFSPGGDNNELISPKDIVIGPDGKIFVYDVRFRGSGLERELRIIEVDPVTGAQTMLNHSGVGTDNGFSDYRGVGVSNSGRIVYFVDFSTSPGGVPGVSSIDLDSELASDGTYFRRRVNASGTRLSQAGSGLSVVPEAPGPVEPTFADVPLDYWAHRSIERLFSSGITGGCGGGNYCPDAPVTRAQMAVFLERSIRGSDYEPPPASGNLFLDIGADDFAASYIEQLFIDGITGGCGGNNYCPQQEISRAQMAVFLLRAMHGPGYSPPPATGEFGDVDLGYWAAAWVEQLKTEGITAGCSAQNFCPDDNVTRAQMAVFLVRAFSL